MTASILIVGINYWPEETGIAPYTTGLAEHLAGAGLRITVLSGMPHYPHWRIADGYRGRTRLREMVRGVEVIRVSHYVPGRQSAVRRGLYEASFFARGAATLGIRRPDVIIGISPSLGGAVLAGLLARRFRSPYGLIIQDLMSKASAQSGIDGADRVAGIVGALEAWAARGATSVGVIASGFRPHVERLGVESHRITHVRNWTHVPSACLDAADVRTRLGWPADATICLHAGNMGHKQGLENLVECARLAKRSRPELLFVLMGDGNQRHRLERLAHGYALPNLRFLPLQPKHFFPEVLNAADLLLVNQRASVHDMSLPGKLTAYLASGRPVVAAVAPESETAREIAASGGGLVVAPDAPSELLRALTNLQSQPHVREALGVAGRAFALRELTPATVLGQYDAFVAGLLAPAPRAVVGYA